MGIVSLLTLGLFREIVSDPAETGWRKERICWITAADRAALEQVRPA
jgi:hypothetical protein